MTVTRLIARPLLASTFLVGGANALKNAPELAAKAKPVIDRFRPMVEKAAALGRPIVPLPRPLKGSAEPHFSFAGLKSAVARAVGSHAPEDIAASFQAAVVDCLIDRTRRGIAGIEATALVVAGGVAANSAVRTALQDLAATNGLRFVAPPLWLCTDNAAMIAWAGAERFAAGLTDPLDTAARARWPLDPTAEKVRGAGVKA